MSGLSPPKARVRAVIWGPEAVGQSPDTQRGRWVRYRDVARGPVLRAVMSFHTPSRWCGRLLLRLGREHRLHEELSLCL